MYPSGSREPEVKPPFFRVASVSLFPGQFAGALSVAGAHTPALGAGPRLGRVPDWKELEG